VKTWIEDYIKSLVSHADQVTTVVDEGLKSLVYAVEVSSDDLSLFAGRNNRLMRAMNSALSLAGARSRVRHVVKVTARARP
jgi:predicted RNA-binding protein YlqC (UPF0109 family)